MMTREEHLEWAKQRALEYLDAGDVQNAVASMATDLKAHPELGTNAYLLAAGMNYAINHDVPGARRWVEGFR